ncbi:hypothetical protein [Streptomyces sp. NPDC058374]|uniref:hypothetical protein n=1 Tax=unclassified Streptomyces TaxID=2593676 RepID=UPI00365D4356
MPAPAGGGLGAAGALGPGVDPGLAADACWALTGPQLYTQLTAERGWSGERYEEWLVVMVGAALGVGSGEG